MRKHIDGAIPLRVDASLIGENADSFLFRRAAQDGQHTAVARVDVAVGLDLLEPRRLELRQLAGERGDQTEQEGSRSQQEQDQEEREQPQLANPPPRPSRGSGTSSAQQNRSIVTLKLASDGRRRSHS